MGDALEVRLPQRAYTSLRNAIRLLQLFPGQMVREREVVEALGMSRTPIHEALVRLEAEGWVRLTPRHGFVVSPLEADDLQEIYEVVEGLEGIAGKLAAKRISTTQLVQLEECILEQGRVVATGDLQRWVDLDDEFHSEVVAAAGNQRLATLMDTCRDQLYRARLFTIKLRPVPLQSVEEHQSIVAALRNDDCDGVRQLLQNHRRRSRKEILTIVRALTPPQWNVIDAATAESED
ncbi:MAG: GntR family transcriptional regulator [Chloroflexi bacterium]|nr:GntR family transcriptional regulator [Chloroflexota bacterium]